MTVQLMMWPEYQNMLFRRELRLLRSFIQSVDIHLNRSRDELSDRISSAVEGLDDEEAASERQWFTSQVFELHADFPRIYSTTTLVAIYTLLEDQLDTLCKMRQEESKLSVSVKGSGIEAFRTYLEKVCGINFPSSSSEWLRINEYRRLRNAIVHGRGKVRPQDDELRKFLETNRADVIDKWGEVSPSKQFCLEATEVVERFMTELTDSIPTTLNCRQLCRHRPVSVDSTPI